MQAPRLPEARIDIAELIPHAGEMILLDRVVAATEDTVTCETESHRGASNPLKMGGILPASATIEYAAQAMAIHAALGRSNGHSRRGFIAVASDVSWTQPRFDDAGSPLEVRAERIASVGGGAQYRFSITDGQRFSASGLLTLSIEEEA